MINWENYKNQFEVEFKNISEWLLFECAKLRLGKASPTILDGILVNVYDDKMAINQIANLSVPDPRTLIIKPYDKSTIKNIVTAINAANLDINPQVDVDIIRISFPVPTEDARKELVKKAKSFCEEAKVKIRRARQILQDEFKKDNSVVEDDKKYFQNELDTITKKFNKKIDDLFIEREKEIMSI